MLQTLKSFFNVTRIWLVPLWNFRNFEVSSSLKNSFEISTIPGCGITPHHGEQVFVLRATFSLGGLPNFPLPVIAPKIGDLSALRGQLLFRRPDTGAHAWLFRSGYLTVVSSTSEERPLHRGLFSKDPGTAAFYFPQFLCHRHHMGLIGRGMKRGPSVQTGSRVSGPRTHGHLFSSARPLPRR